MPDLTPAQWALALAGAFSMGVSKAGLNGLGLLHVLIFAFIFGARASTGLILPMLIVADVLAVRAFQAHARWTYIRRMLPPTLLGVVTGFLLMGRIDEGSFRIAVGGIILALTVMQAARTFRPGWFGNVPHSTVFAWPQGIAAGVATLHENAPGEIYTIYALSISLPKFELVGTGAWFFFIVNVSKVPLSAALGLIGRDTLAINLLLLPAVFAGIAFGRQITARVPQALFERLLLVLAAVAALRLIGIW
jgi:uncharacterized membrane protein YfcA